MRRVLVLAILLVFGLSAAWFAVPMVRQDRGRWPSTPGAENGQAKRQSVSIGGVPLTVELATTPTARARGLSGRDHLPAGAGMLFIFPAAEPRTFWMKETRIPLDLVWIRDGRVIGVTADVLPEPGVPDDALRRYPSPGAVDHVLEVNGGWTRAHEISVGDRVVIE